MNNFAELPLEPIVPLRAGAFGDPAQLEYDMLTDRSPRGPMLPRDEFTDAPQLQVNFNPDLVKLFLTIHDPELARKVAGFMVGQAVTKDVVENPGSYAPDVTPAAFMTQWMQHQDMMHMAEMVGNAGAEDTDDDDGEGEPRRLRIVSTKPARSPKSTARTHWRLAA